MDSEYFKLSVVRDRARPRRVLLMLDEELVRTTSKDVVRALYLKDGDSLSANDLNAAVADAEPSCALDRALRVLNYKDRSVAQLTTSLIDDGYAPEAVSFTIERLVELQMLDDARFAASYVRAKTRTGWGRRRVSIGLAQAGIPDEIATAALDREAPTEDQRELATAKIRPSDLADPKTRERAVRRLVSRGFTWDDARNAVRASQNMPDDNPQDPTQ